jgi:poly(hydroxyalkanoate) depolymerase family esterase
MRTESLRPLRSLSLLCLAGLAVGCGSAEEPPASEEVGSVVAAVGAGTFEAVASFGSNPGNLKMYRYVPSPAPAADAPLVVAMHACSQNATAYRSSGWEEVADKLGFYVVYPEQQSANNALGCFNWAGEYGVTANLIRGQGENQSIKEMVDQMLADYSIDPTRVFATGHSGGGAQVALMMAVWPDVFAGGGILAGIPYECTTQYLEVSSCLSPGKDLTAEQWGAKALEGYPGYAGAYPRLSVWHGTADNLVAPTNADQLVEQWTNVHGLASTPTSSDMVDGYPRDLYQDGGGKTIVESWHITGAGHGTFIDPDKGCGTAGSYFLDEDVCAAQRISEFWGIAGGSSGSGGAGGAGSGGAGVGGSAAASGGAGSGAGAPSSSSGGEDGDCVPGRMRPCDCPGGGESFQTCGSDGSYGECDCPDVVDEPSSCAQAAGGTDGGRAWPMALLALALGAGVARRRRRA